MKRAAKIIGRAAQWPLLLTLNALVLGSAREAGDGWLVALAAVFMVLSLVITIGLAIPYAAETIDDDERLAEMRKWRDRVREEQRR